METLKTAPPGISGCVINCGIDDPPPAVCSRMTATAVAHQGIFANAFADEWMEPEPESHAHSTIIDHVVNVCDFSTDSVMVKYIEQHQWSTLAHIVSIGVEEVEEFFTAKTNGITIEKAFLLYSAGVRVQLITDKI
jgi:hypothetical protein